MSLAEIQEAIEKLAPEERAALREWLDESDPDIMAVIRERVRQIRAGEATLIDGNQVQEEMRQLIRQIANHWRAGSRFARW
jgi:predicted kinase